MKKLRHLVDESRNLGNRGFVKLLRGEMTEELLFNYPNAFLLLTQVALRARRTNCKIAGLVPGEALIGDFKSIGLTRQKYRTALQLLCTLGFLTIKTTNRGTVARIIGTGIFDINAEANNQQVNNQATIRQPSGNHQATINEEVKKIKIKAIKRGERPSIEDLRAYISEKGYNVNPEKWLAHYEANGWMVGKNRMHDWKAAVRTWHHSNFNDGGNGRSRSSLQVGAHTEQEVPTGPPSEYEVLTRMHTQTLREVNSLDRLLTDPTMRERYPEKISEWQSKHDKLEIEKENLVRKLSELEVKDAEVGEQMEQLAEVEQEHDQTNPSL